MSPEIGVLMLDTTFPRIVGDIGNPASFSFPVNYLIVEGANPERVVIEADRSLIEPFIRAGHRLVEEGARAIGTSCGFLALFHRELNEALPVPVYSSSLLQVHLAASVVRSGKRVGILTVRKRSLTPHHLDAVGISSYPLSIFGMDEYPEFSSVFIDGKSHMDQKLCYRELREAASRMISEEPDIGAVVLECTNMPAFRGAIREAVGSIPVFDVVTMLQYAHEVLQ